MFMLQQIEELDRLYLWRLDRQDAGIIEITATINEYLFSEDVKKAFKKLIRRKSNNEVECNDLKKYIFGLKSPVCVVIGRRFHKSDPFPNILMDLHQTDYYMDLSVPLLGKKSCWQVYNVFSREVSILLGIAAVLGIPVIADEMQCSELPGCIKSCLERIMLEFEETHREFVFPKVSILLYGSHQQKVAYTGSYVFFSVRNTKIYYCPIYPLGLCVKLMGGTSDISLQLLAHFGLYHMNIEEEKEDHLELDKTTVPNVELMLETDHYNSLVEISKLGVPNEIGVVDRDLVKIFISGGKKINPGLKSSSPLEREESILEIDLGFVMKPLVQNYLLQELKQELGVTDKYDFFHGSAPYKFDGVLCGDEKVFIIFMKINSSEQYLVHDILMRISRSCNHEALELFQNKLIVPVFLNSGIENKDEEKDDKVEKRPVHPDILTEMKLFTFSDPLIISFGNLIERACENFDGIPVRECAHEFKLGKRTTDSWAIMHS